MKKGIVTLLLLVAIGAGAYVAYREFAPVRVAEGWLDQVPADTLWFAGYVEPYDFTPWLRRTDFKSPMPGDDELAVMREEMSAAGDAGRMLFGLYVSYLQRTGELAAFTEALGSTGRTVAYTVGVAPVFRMEFQNEAAFWQFIDEAEQAGEVLATADTVQSLSLRTYPFPDRAQGNPARLVVAYRDGSAYLMLDPGVAQDRVLPLALGLKAPKQSLAQTGRLGQIAQNHGFQSLGVSFLNHQSLVDAVTGDDGNQAAAMIDALLAGDGEAEAALASWRTEACRQDLNQIVTLWPQTVMGYDELDLEAGRMQARMIVESTDQEALNRLKSIRGHVAESLLGAAQTPMLGVGLGADVSQLAPAVQGLWRSYTTAGFSCAALVASQQQLRQNNPAALAMGTALVSGLKGFSLAVFDLDMDFSTGQPQLRSIAAAVVMSADDPQALLNTAQALNPNFGALQVPADGNVVTLPVSPAPGVELKAVQHGPHLAIFAGEDMEARVAALKEEGVEANGLTRMVFDYSKFIPLLKQSMLHTGALAGQMDERTRADIEAMRPIDMVGRFGMDVTDKGVEFSFAAEL